MRLLDKKTCKKLKELGCESRSDFYFDYCGSGPEYTTADVACLPAFSLEDFVSTDTYATENCKIIWGEWNVDGFKFPRDFKAVRHWIIDSDDWVSYIEEALKEKEV